MTRALRNELIEEASEKAKKMGANAITGLRFETVHKLFTYPRHPSTTFVEVVLYGTAIAVQH